MEGFLVGGSSFVLPERQSGSDADEGGASGCDAFYIWYDFASEPQFL